MPDTLKLANSLEAAGFTRKQAEGQASAMAEFLDQAAAVTKSDLQLTEDRLTLAMGRSKNGRAADAGRVGGGGGEGGGVHSCACG
jgi:hypothetical protein